MLLLLYTAAGVRSEFLLSFVYVSRPMVHCKVLLLSSPKAWLVSFNGLVRYCVYHTTWVLLVGVSWTAHGVLQGLVGLFAFAFEAWLAPFNGCCLLRPRTSSYTSHMQTWPARMMKSRPSGVVGLFAFAFEAWLAPFDGRLRAVLSDIAYIHQTWPVRTTKSRTSGFAPQLRTLLHSKA